MTEIKNIIYKHYGILSNCYYLTIDGGSGHGEKGIGGTYKFVAGYFNPTELDGRNNISLDIWCDKNNLPYITANVFS